MSMKAIVCSSSSTFWAGRSPATIWQKMQSGSGSGMARHPSEGQLRWTASHARAWATASSGVLTSPA